MSRFSLEQYSSLFQGRINNIFPMSEQHRLVKIQHWLHTVQSDTELLRSPGCLEQSEATP